jgi:hypothetical protein
MIRRTQRAPPGGEIVSTQPGFARSFNSIRDTIEPECRGVAQPGSASALGAEGRGFESLRPDHRKLLIYKVIFHFLATHLLFTATAL